MKIGFKNKTEELDKTREGEPLYKDDFISHVSSELRRRKTERRPLELQWRLNANFLMGNQYCDIHPGRLEIIQSKQTRSYLQHECFNRIAPLYSTRLSYLRKMNFHMSVKPRTNELDDFQKADVSTSILKNFQNTSGFESKKDTFLAWAELTGTSFWLSWWNPYKGLPYGKIKIPVTDENGVPSLDENNNQKYKIETVYEGDVDYGILSPYEVYPESIYKQKIEDQRSIIIEQIMTVEDIYDRFGIHADGHEIETFALTPIPVNGGFGYRGTVNAIGVRTSSDSEKVITYMERPGRRHSQGILAIIIGEDKLVYYGKLPYKKIPLQKYTSFEVAGQFFGKSFIEDEIPLQRAYNGCINRFHEYIKNIAIDRFFVSEGSIVNIEEYEENGVESGGFLIYQEGYSVPQKIPMDTIPPSVFNERYDLENSMLYVACLSQLQTTGSTPQGVTSGTAIATLKENDNTRIALQGSYLRECIRELAKTWLSIYKQYATTYRALSYTGGNDIGSVLTWSRDDVSDYDVSFDTQNELEFSEAEQRERFMRAYESGAFTDSTGKIPQKIKNKMVRFVEGDYYRELMSVNEKQIQRATRENSFFKEYGIIPKIEEIDDDEIHIEEHELFILDIRFDVLKRKSPELCRKFINHYTAHKERLKELNARKAAELLQMSGGGAIE